MKRTLVDSSSIEALSYDPDSRTLRVWFISGSIYDYYGVPYEEYEVLLNAASIGAHFNHEIKGAYSYQKIR